MSKIEYKEPYLTMENLQILLTRLFFGDKLAFSKFVLPMTGKFLTATLDPENMVSTWVGYRIQRIMPRARSNSEVVGSSRADYNRYKLRDCEMILRILSVGKQSYEAIVSTLFWDDRADVKDGFEKHLAQLAYSPRKMFSQVYEQEGGNSELAWYVDLKLFAWLYADFEPLYWTSLPDGKQA
jgi:hypothetical protein